MKYLELGVKHRYFKLFFCKGVSFYKYAPSYVNTITITTTTSTAISVSPTPPPTTAPTVTTNSTITTITKMMSLGHSSK